MIDDKKIDDYDNVNNIQFLSSLYQLSGIWTLLHSSRATKMQGQFT
jgi:hypothetical protein